jgi:hypothetical protein
MTFKGKDLVSILLITIILAQYLMFATMKSNTLIDVWPLEGILVESVMVLLIIVTLSYMFLHSTIFLILILIMQTFLMIIVPVLKYPVPINIVGPWDSTAHYSYAKWIVVYGHIENSGILYYSDQYGYHPGNGLLPATVSIISAIDLGWSMNIILIMMYSTYMLLTLSVISRLRYFNTSKEMGLLILSLSSLTIYFPIHYCGSGLGYVYVALILYLVLRILINHEIMQRNIITIVMAFLGLLFTHYASTVIVLSYIVFITMFLFLFTIYKGRKVLEKATRRGLLLIFLLIIMFFLAYEIFTDLRLFATTTQYSIHILHSLFIKEVSIAARAIQMERMSFADLLRYAISTYTKILLPLIIAIIHLFVTIIMYKRNKLNLSREEKPLLYLLIASYPTWLIGWAGEASILLSGSRAHSVINFFLLINSIIIFGKLSQPRLKKLSYKATFVIITVFGFIANFGLPFNPTLYADNEVYTYPVFSQVGFNIYVYHATPYISQFSDNSTYLLCLQPYIGFGLCDLLWFKPRIPSRGFISVTGYTIEDYINNALQIIEEYNNVKGVLVPIPTRDRILPAAIGLLGLYRKPLMYLLENYKGLVYNNQFYILFYSS